MNRLKTIHEIDNSPNTVKYYWATDSGLHSTSRSLALSALAGGVFFGAVLGIKDQITSVVVTALPDDGDAFIDRAEKQFEDYSKTHPDQKGFTPKFDSYVDLDSLSIEPESAHAIEAMRVYSTVKEMFHKDEA